jgi:NAD-dependent DNA ligase
MAASTVFGTGFGTRKLKAINTGYPNIMNEKWDKETMIEKIKELDGFDTLTATQFTGCFNAFKLFYKELSEVVDLKNIIKPAKKIGTLLTGMKIVFTGFRDKKLEEFVETNGGKVATSVSKQTSLVIYSDKSGAKYQKAEQLGVTCMTVDEFKKKYKA